MNVQSSRAIQGVDILHKLSGFLMPHFKLSHYRATPDWRRCEAVVGQLVWSYRLNAKLHSFHFLTGPEAIPLRMDSWVSSL